MDQTARSFDEIVNEVLRASGSPGNVSTMRTTVRALVNEEYCSLVELVEDRRLIRRFTAAMTTDTATDSDTPRMLVDLPYDFGVPRWAEWRDASTTPDRHHRLECLDHEDFMKRTQGQARAYALGIPGLVAVRHVMGSRQDLMTASVAYEAVSSSASDTTQSITVRGFTTEARTAPAFLTIALNGTTAVALGSYWFIEQIGVSAATAGIITIRKDAGDVTVGQIMPWGRSCAYAALEFDKGLDRDLTLQMEHTIRAPLMSEAGDVPFYLPAAGHGLLGLGAMIRGGMYKKLAESQAALALYAANREKFLSTIRPGGYARTRIRLH